MEATGPDGAVVNYGPVSYSDAVDGQDIPLDPEDPAICSPPSGSTFPLGDTLVTCSVTDGAGNTGSASFTITVEDTTAPVVTVPADFTVEATGPDGAVVNYGPVSYSDAVDGQDIPLDPEDPAICSPPSGSTFPLGDTLVTCSVTDGAGNTGSASFTITVEDTTAPVVTVPADFTVEATGPDGAVVNYGPVSYSDAVDGQDIPLDPEDPAICSPPSGSTFPLGDTLVTCSVTDGAGNTGSASFTITVEDTTAPVVTVPADFTVEATGPDGAVVNYGPVSYSDAVDGQDIPLDPEDPAICSPPSGSTFPLGDTLVTCSVTDGAGNTGSASFTITVEDTTAPVVTVPADFTVEATGPDGAVVNYGPVSYSDAVDGQDIPLDPEDPAICSPPSGSTFPLGDTLVTCSVTDGAGNTGSASFTITVEDTTAPVVTVPADFTVEATGPDGAVVNYGPVSYSDAVDGQDIPLDPEDPAICSPPSGSTFPLGDTLVTCSVTDGAGNTGSASFTITVEDTTAPVVTVPADFTVEATGPDGGCSQLWPCLI